jgi:hypothetical protein
VETSSSSRALQGRSATSSSSRALQPLHLLTGVEISKAMMSASVSQDDPQQLDYGCSQATPIPDAFSAVRSRQIDVSP